MHAYVINNSGSSNNLPCYPPDNHQSQNAVYWRMCTNVLCCSICKINCTWNIWTMLTYRVGWVSAGRTACRQMQVRSEAYYSPSSTPAMSSWQLRSHLTTCSDDCCVSLTPTANKRLTCKSKNKDKSSVWLLIRNSLQSIGVSPAIWDHTELAATRLIT